MKNMFQSITRIYKLNIPNIFTGHLKSHSLGFYLAILDGWLL